MMNDANVQGLDTREAWRKSTDFAVMVYEDVIPSLPSIEKWNLQDELRRTVSSIPANIAEGHGRHYDQENIHFCHVASGSLAEVHSHVTLAWQLGYIPAEQFEALRNSIGELIRIINGYIAYLKRTKVGSGEPGASLCVRDESSPYLTAEPGWPDSSGIR
jgi:four helix bundle protein